MFWRVLLRGMQALTGLTFAGCAWIVGLIAWSALEGPTLPASPEPMATALTVRGRGTTVRVQPRLSDAPQPLPPGPPGPAGAPGSPPPTVAEAPTAAQDSLHAGGEADRPALDTPAAEAEGVADAGSPPAIPTDLQFAPSLLPGALPGQALGPSRAALEDAAESAGEPPPPTSAPLTSNRVVIRLLSTPAGADIRVDGRMRGRTPAKVMLNPGTYELELEHEGAVYATSLNAKSDQRLCFSREGASLSPADCSER